MGPGQDHRRGPRAAARPRVQRLTRRVEVDPDRVVGWVERFAARHGGVHVVVTEGGIALSSPDGAEARLVPPWPGEVPDGERDSARTGGHGARSASPVDDLVNAALRPRTVGLLLVRRGGFAVGVAEGADLVASKVGSRYVQGRTKAGGWSQQRYARRRDAQAQAAFAKAAEVAASVLLPRAAELDGLVPGGDRAAVSAVLADARLRRLGALPQGRFLAVPDPRRAVLEDAVRRSRAVLVDVFDPLRE